MSADDTSGNATAFDLAAAAVEDLSRMGWRLSILPAQVLPQAIRAPLFDAVRWWAEAAAGVLPPPFDRTADGLAAEVDDLEGRAARREDLGRRLRRERRRAAREEPR